MDGARLAGAGAVHPLQLVTDELLPVVLRHREQEPEPLRRHERREHAVVLRPGRGEHALAFGEAVRTDVAPDRAVEDRHHLRRQGVPLRVEGGEPLGRDAFDCDVAQGPDRKGADDRLSRERLAAGPHRAAGPRDGDGLDDGAVPHAAAQRGSHPLRHFAASLRHLQRLPAAVVVEAVSPAAADLRSSARSEWCWIEPSASATRRSQGSGSPTGAHRRSGARHRARHGRAGSRRDATRDRRGRPWRRARRRGVRRARSRPARPPSRRASPPSGRRPRAGRTSSAPRGRYSSARASARAPRRGRGTRCGTAPTTSPPSWTGRPSSTRSCSTRPPGRSRASSTTTSAPPAARSRAAARPARPAPSTSTSVKPVPSSSAIAPRISLAARSRSTRPR